MVSCSGASGGPSSLPSRQVRCTVALLPRPASTSGAMTFAASIGASFVSRPTLRTTSGEIGSEKSLKTLKQTEI